MCLLREGISQHHDAVARQQVKYSPGKREGRHAEVINRTRCTPLECERQQENYHYNSNLHTNNNVQHCFFRIQYLPCCKYKIAMS